MNINKILKYYTLSLQINRMLICEMLNQASNLVFLKNYNTQFDEIIITFTYRKGIPLEIEDNVSLTLNFDKQK